MFHTHLNSYWPQFISNMIIIRGVTCSPCRNYFCGPQNDQTVMSDLCRSNTVQPHSPVRPATNSLSGDETFPGVPFCLPLCSSMDCMVDLGPAAYQECERGPDAIPPAPLLPVWHQVALKRTTMQGKEQTQTTSEQICLQASLFFANYSVLDLQIYIYIYL